VKLLIRTGEANEHYGDRLMELSNWRLGLSLTVVVVSGFFLAACDPESTVEKELPPLPDGLSEMDLLKKAVANMHEVESFRAEFINEHITIESKRGSQPWVGSLFSDPVTITANIQPMERGILVEAGVAIGGQVEHSLWIISDGVYSSNDEGKTWSEDTSGGWGAGLIVGAFLDPWEESYTLLENDFKSGWSIDSSLSVEEVLDGIHTRKLVANIEDTQDWEESFVGFYARSGVKTMSIWVTTEVSPTIRQMRMEGLAVPFGVEEASVNQQQTAIVPTNSEEGESYFEVSFRATWKWSKFNEEFSEVSAPPKEKIVYP
jgi:hypothetical protein